MAAFCGSPVIRYSPSSIDQLPGSAWLMLTAIRNASMALGASRSSTKQRPRSSWSRLKRGW